MRLYLYIAIFLSGLLGQSVLPAYAGHEHLYSATTIITGQDNLPERKRGMLECLKMVVAKASGNRLVLTNPEVLDALQRVEEYVASFSYLDRKEGIQISDEQGTRDRSFEFTVLFDEKKINTLLAKAGTAPWLKTRPEILILLNVWDGQADYLVTETSERGWGQREVIFSLRNRTALSLTIPRSDAVLIETEAKTILTGRMSVNKEGYWVSDWKLSDADNKQSWISPIGTFDKVIAHAIWKSADLLAKENR